MAVCPSSLVDSLNFESVTPFHGLATTTACCPPVTGMEIGPVESPDSPPLPCPCLEKVPTLPNGDYHYYQNSFIASASSKILVNQ